MPTFEIFGAPPHQADERHLTTRPSRALADGFAANLGGFGYTKVRVQEEGGPPPSPPGPAPAPTPAPAPAPAPTPAPAPAPVHAPAEGTPVPAGSQE